MKNAGDVVEKIQCKLNNSENELSNFQSENLGVLYSVACRGFFQGGTRSAPENFYTLLISK